MTVTLDVLVRQLQSEAAFREYTRFLEARRDKVSSMLLNSTSLTHAEMMSMLGEIRGLNYALNAPDRLYRQQEQSNGRA